MLAKSNTVSAVVRALTLLLNTTSLGQCCALAEGTRQRLGVQGGAPAVRHSLQDARDELERVLLQCSPAAAAALADLNSECKVNKSGSHP